MRRVSLNNPDYRSSLFSLRSVKLRTGLMVSATILLILNFIVLPVVFNPHFFHHLTTQKQNSIQQIVKDVLADNEIDNKMMRQIQDVTEIRLPNQTRFFLLYGELRNRLAMENAEILSCVEDISNGTIHVAVGAHGDVVQKLAFRIVYQKTSNPKIALIIDDFGYSFNQMTKDFIFFPQPITLSIIPGLKETRQIAQHAKLAQKQFLVHMPMEPLNEPFKDDGYILTTDLNPGMIRLRLQRAFSDLPDAVGLNNHQGSKATCDEKVMRPTLSELKRMNKFFVDSRTNSKSVAMDVARSLGLRSVANQAFLDGEDHEAYIRTQLLNVAEMARREKQVIAIGHARRNTLKVLQEMVPELVARGFDFVYVSTLL